MDALGSGKGLGKAGGFSTSCYTAHLIRKVSLLQRLWHTPPEIPGAFLSSILEEAAKSQL